MLLESVGCIMKKNRRVLTVNGNQYVWWHGIGEGLASVTLSPFEDKTSKVKVEFRDAAYQCVSRNSYTFPLYFELEKDCKRRTLKLLESGMAALLAAELSKRDVFQPRNQVVMNGYELLDDLGYDILHIENGIEF